MKIINSIFTLGVIIVLNQNIVAQEKNKSLTDTIDIEEVVVTGSKASVSRNMVPYTISVVKNSEVSSSGESAVLPVLSQMVPGLFVTERGITGFGVSTGSAGQISIRGIGASPTTQVLILLNGNPQYMGIMGHPLADAYRSANIERVEVIRGPASALYGSNAMGGVINIITKEQKADGINAHLSQEYGSFNTLKMTSGMGFKKDKFDIFAGFNYDRTDGHREASYFNIADGYLKAGYRINNHLRATVDMSLAKFKGADPGLDTAEIVKPGDTLDILRAMGALALNNTFDKTDGSFRLFYNFGKHDITSGFYSKDYNVGIMWYQNFHLFNGNTLTTGLDLKKYGGDADNMKFHSQIVDTTVNELGGYISFQQQFFDKLIVNASLRLEQHTVFGTEWIPSVGMAYQLFENSKIKASYGKGYRSPTIRELFIKAFPPLPNAELKPEYLNSAELSWEQFFIDKKIRWEGTVYWMKTDQLIQPVINEMGAKQYQNTQGVKNLGIEVSINHFLNEQFNWYSNYSFIDMEQAVIGTPKEKFAAAVNYTPAQWSFQISMQHIKELNLNANKNLTATYLLMNARVCYQLFEELNLYVKGENLLNQKYTMNYGYPMPGFTLMAGISVHLHQ